jgi:D-lyxose ketol-isomerase
MHMPEGQRSVIHHHRSKMEDICNHGPGNIMIRFWGVGEDKGLADDPLTLSLSGRRIVQPAGEPLRIEPGESVCVTPATYHQFWAEEGRGEVLSMEVSSVCNDRTDNYFLESGDRFPPIEEDEPPRYVLCSEYGR